MIAPPIVEVLVLTNLLVIFLSLGIYQLYRQLFTSNGWRYEEGYIKALQYVLGLPALVSLVLLLADFDELDWYSISLDVEFLACGLVILNAAALTTLWSHRSLGNYWSGDLETKPDHQVVHSGPYRWIRHPQYSSYLFLTFGLFLTTGNWLVSALVFLYFSAVAARSWKEEAMLLDRLGRNYALYRSRTGRFLPKILLSRTRVQPIDS
jgi:protein-S-isoprenylcysteine O-methyltransferase Ste14